MLHENVILRNKAVGSCGFSDYSPDIIMTENRIDSTILSLLSDESLFLSDHSDPRL